MREPGRKQIHYANTLRLHNCIDITWARKGLAFAESQMQRCERSRTCQAGKPGIQYIECPCVRDAWLHERVQPRMNP